MKTGSPFQLELQSAFHTSRRVPDERSVQLGAWTPPLWIARLAADERDNSGPKRISHSLLGSLLYAEREPGVSLLAAERLADEKAG
jgi:hypothetical protein